MKNNQLIDEIDNSSPVLKCTYYLLLRFIQTKAKIGSLIEMRRFGPGKWESIFEDEPGVTSKKVIIEPMAIIDNRIDMPGFPRSLSADSLAVLKLLGNI